MDKKLLKAYIRTIVEEEVERILPKLLSEAVLEIKQLSENATPAKNTKPKIDRSRLAELLNISYDRKEGTITAGTGNLIIPENAPTDADPAVIDAINRDYSAVMKKLNLS